MQYRYIRYADFDQQVKTLVGSQLYELNKHHLPEVTITHRDRFLDTLHKCSDICIAYAIVYIGHKLPDENFMRFSKYALTAHMQKASIV